MHHYDIIKQRYIAIFTKYLLGVYPVSYKTKLKLLYLTIL